MIEISTMVTTLLGALFSTTGNVVVLTSGVRSSAGQEPLTQVFKVPVPAPTGSVGTGSGAGSAGNHVEPLGAGSAGNHVEPLGRAWWRLQNLGAGSSWGRCHSLGIART